MTTVKSAEEEESDCMKKEFEWILSTEVHAVLNQLQKLLVQCSYKLMFVDHFAIGVVPLKEKVEESGKVKDKVNADEMNQDQKTDSKQNNAKAKCSNDNNVDKTLLTKKQKKAGSSKKTQHSVKYKDEAGPSKVRNNGVDDVARYCSTFKVNKMYTLTGSPDLLKTFISINGDCISEADIQFRILRPHQPAITYHTYIHSKLPWKLYQLQDVENHMKQALYIVEKIGKECKFCNAKDVLHIFDKILSCLQRGQTCLVVPQKTIMEEWMKASNANRVFQKCLIPNLPEDLALSFYIQSQKLVMAVYQVVGFSHHGTRRGSQLKMADVYRAECNVPWLNEILVLVTVAMQTCQQLKDKICVFAQYNDFQAHYSA